MNNEPAVLNSKPHYDILDGLRGVAAFTVVAFHIFEANSKGMLEQIINHGYLAVDFFFMLSGFVISYAYDDRWNRMTTGGFFKRRLERLQPMVIIGMVIGALLFYYADSPKWPMIHTVPIWQVVVVMLVGFTLIPLPPSMDIRGWQEMHPLNGPGWSLFYEYVANILYALILRRISKLVLSILTIVSAGFLIHYAVTNPNGDLMGGWTLNFEQLKIGFIRLFFPFLAGLLMARTVRIGRINNAFLVSSIILLIALAIPRIGGVEGKWLNGVYESIVIICIFPLIIYIGASGRISGTLTKKFSKILGNLSYPIYITHFPLIYIYSAWVSRNPQAETVYLVAYGVLTFLLATVIGYITFYYYDEPFRRWLKKKFGNA